MDNIILTPYAPILVESTRAIGYSFESALADIIDNSIAKNAKEINIYFDSNSPQFIAILDDAIGMNKEELTRAMRYGSYNSLDVRDEKDLGRFGLGLKMASLSQCRKLTVITKQNDVVLAAQWDIDYIIETQEWSLRFFDENDISNFKFKEQIEKLNSQNSGTIVIWENFDKLCNSSAEPESLFDEKIELARKHIALVFHRFLTSQAKNIKLSIKFNGLLVEGVDPFLLDHPGTQLLEEHNLKMHNHIIKVKPYILPHISKLTNKDKKKLGDLEDLKQNQGFYVYRNNRLIIWGTWFRLIKQYELNKLARISIDIPNSLDSEWDIDIKKSKASLPDVLKKPLLNVIENAVGRSERVYKYRGRAVKSDELNHIWNVIDERGKIQYLVNRDLAIFKQLEDSLDETGVVLLDSLIKMVENSFPYADVYCRLAQSKDVGDTTNNLDFDEVYNIAQSMLSSIKVVNGNIESAINELEKLDFFAKYPEVLKRVKKEHLND